MTELYPVIAHLETEGTPVAVACDVLGVGRSGYYQSRRRSPGPRQRQDLALMPVVQSVFWQNRRRYGARRIAKELTHRFQPCGPARVARLMKQLDLVAIQPRSFRPKTTQSRHTLGYSPNLLLNAPPPRAINRVWVGDISYIPLKTGAFCYLALLMDLFSRKIIGWQIEDHMAEALVLAALVSAIRDRQPPARMIHHTDRGGQYAGTEYRAVLKRAFARQSMSRADSVHDNAFLESCFGTIKRELEMTVYDDIRAARREIGGYIGYYNVGRLHSSLGYRTPVEFEALYRQCPARSRR